VPIRDQLDRAVTAIENSTALDGLGSQLASLVGKVVRPGPVEDTLSGTQVGHPAHPSLVVVPLGAWVSATVLDATGDTDAARRMVGVGLLASGPAVATGLSDWANTMGAERRVGLVHAACNDVAIGLYAGSWFARRSGRNGVGAALSGAGLALLTVAGWLGGHLAYAQGVGVDTTAFQSYPDDWVDAIGEDEVRDGELAHVEVAGVPVLFTRRHGSVVAVADRCTHRGAPLHEGEIRDGCVVCPWHASAFDLDTGGVASGPAVRPQPMLQTRVQNGRIHVRRDEERTLRTNPAGR
jgi:nitrite reductase/ring-hydroxylating ferredoxin subunit/uncharacterized membrane protein